MNRWLPQTTPAAQPRPPLRPGRSGLWRYASALLPHPLALFLAGAFVCWPCLDSPAQAIPEPSLVFYGTVRHTVGAQAYPWSFGTLVWTFRSGTNPAVTVRCPLSELDGPFNYVLQVPCETVFAGGASTNALRLRSQSAAFDRTDVAIEVMGALFPATVLAPAPSIVWLASKDRGRLEQVDLNAQIPLIDIDGNGLPDVWELHHFEGIGVDAYADPDWDGANILDEYLAGTDPNDPNSILAFLHWESAGPGQIRIQWQSVSDKTYSLHRTTVLPFAPGTFSVIASNLPATPPQNTYLDATAGSAGPYFYRLVVDNPNPMP